MIDSSISASPAKNCRNFPLGLYVKVMLEYLVHVVKVEAKHPPEHNGIVRSIGAMDW